MKIKSFLILFFIGCIYLMSYSFLDAASLSSVSVSNSSSRYLLIAKSTVGKYVERLKSTGYTNTQILSALKERRAIYQKKTSSYLYQGTYKFQIDAIISIIDSYIRSYEGTPSPSTPTSPVACTQEVKMCSDGSYVSRSGSKCEFTACPTVSYPGANRITDVTNSMNSYILSSRFNTSASSYYKEYDVYLFTPTINGQSYGKTQATSFIDGPEKLMYNIYNSYTITTQFQPTYDTQKIASIRSQLPTSGYVFKKNMIVSPQNSESFSVRSSQEFNQNATKTFNDTYYYETYFLYVAKDNSEAFTLRYAQTGKKNGYNSDMQINTVSYVGMTHNATLTYKNGMYSTYNLMFYSPSLNSDLYTVRNQLGINTALTTLNYSQNLSWGLNNTVYYSVNGYKVDPANISTVKSYFNGIKSVNPMYPGNVYDLYFGLRSENNFSEARMSDGALRTYLLLVSPDNLEAYITEFTQYAPYLQ